MARWAWEVPRGREGRCHLPNSHCSPRQSPLPCTSSGLSLPSWTSMPAACWPESLQGLPRTHATPTACLLHPGCGLAGPRPARYDCTSFLCLVIHVALF